MNWSEALRKAYLDDIQQFVAEDLIFLDKSIFNKKTGWRYNAYAPIGDEACYTTDITRGRTWAICSAMTLGGWLQCMAVKEGYFKADDFIKWLQDSLIPAINKTYQGRTMVIILDNVSIHVGRQVADIIQGAGHLVQYLPPYSPDYNPIELSFSVLKAWIKVNWTFLRLSCDSFGEFLHLAIRESRCDRFAKQHFKHAGGVGVYIQEADLIRFTRYMESLEAPEELNEAILNVSS
jgi:transposase